MSARFARLARGGGAKLRTGVGELLRIVRREPVITPGELDLNSLPHFLSKDDPVILDIGCNDGGHTLLFLTLFKKAKVYSFEPDPRAQESFRIKVTDKRAKLFNLAISSMDGATDFYVSSGFPSQEWEDVLPKGWDLSGSIKTPKIHLKVYPWCTFDKTIKVRTI